MKVLFILVVCVPLFTYCQPKVQFEGDLSHDTVVYIQANKSNGDGLIVNSKFGIGIKGFGPFSGVVGSNTSTLEGTGAIYGSSPGAGVYGISTSANGQGVYGVSQINGIGVQGKSNSGPGIFGTSNSLVGVLGTSVSGIGVQGVSTTNVGGYFDGGGGVGILIKGNDSSWGSGGDDAVIRTMPSQSSGDLILVSNDNIHLHLDDLNLHPAEGFVVYAGDNFELLKVIGNGNLYAGSLSGIGDKLDLQWDALTGEIGYDNSSMRFKENILNLEDDWNKILAVRPVQYTRPGDTAIEYGYIAEELDSLGLQTLVIYDREGLPLAIRYDKIILYLTEILKKHDQLLAKKDQEILLQNQENKILKEQIAGIKIQLDNLQKKLSDLTATTR